MDAYLASIDIASEVMVLDVDVLSTRTHFGHFSNLNGTAVVLEDSAMHLWLDSCNFEAMLLVFLEQLHDRDRSSKCIG